MAHDGKTSGEDANVKAGLILVGIVGQARGLKGEVKVKSFTADPKALGDYGPLTDATGTKTFQVKVLGEAKGQVFVRIKGVADRNQADALKGQALYIERSRLPETDEDEFYYSDLIGLKAERTDGQAFGDVLSVEDYGAGTFLEVASRDFGRVLVPFTKAVVPVVDIEGGRVVIDPPEGLLEPGEPEPQTSDSEGNDDE